MTNNSRANTSAVITLQRAGMGARAEHIPTRRTSAHFGFSTRPFPHCSITLVSKHFHSTIFLRLFTVPGRLPASC